MCSHRLPQGHRSSEDLGPRQGPPAFWNWFWKFIVPVCVWQFSLLDVSILCSLCLHTKTETWTHKCMCMHACTLHKLLLTEGVRMLPKVWGHNKAAPSPLRWLWGWSPLDQWCCSEESPLLYSLKWTLHTPLPRSLGRFPNTQPWVPTVWKVNLQVTHQLWVLTFFSD